MDICRNLGHTDGFIAEFINRLCWARPLLAASSLRLNQYRRDETSETQLRGDGCRRVGDDSIAPSSSFILYLQFRFFFNIKVFLGEKYDEKIGVAKSNKIKKCK